MYPIHTEDLNLKFLSFEFEFENFYKKKSRSVGEIPREMAKLEYSWAGGEKLMQLLWKVLSEILIRFKIFDESLHFG